MLRVEIGLVLLFLFLAFIYPSLGSRWFERLESGFRKLSDRRGLSIVVAGVSALLLRLVLLPLLPIPEPSVQDEFSYLLNADTFLHGRLTNPTHPMWIHFESFNIIHQPTYASIYPPAGGLFLALGRVIGGHPFWGVWLSVGLMCGAICWMLQGWIAPPWALLGALLCVLRLSSFSYWANSYMVPAAAAIGGALALGALPRLKQSQQIANVLVLGIGLAILANSRPYEGLVYSIPIAVALLAWMFRPTAPPGKILFLQVIAPLAVILLITGAEIAYYDWRVTGSPFVMPHQVGVATYSMVPKFLWQHARPDLQYHHQVILDYNNNELMLYRRYQLPLGLLMMSVLKIVLFWLFYVGSLFTLPLFMAIVTLPPGFSWSEISREARFLLLACGISLLGLSLETIFIVHYAAPMTGLIVLLVLIALRRVRSWRWRQKQVGLMITRVVPLIAVACLLARAAATPLHLSLYEKGFGRCWWSNWNPEFGRAAIVRLLDAYPGRHLVLVKYKPDHDTIGEWVYNDADIDKSKIVWAHKMDPAEDEKLMDYFKDRHVWLVEADEKPPKLSVYPARPAPEASALSEGRE